MLPNLRIEDVGYNLALKNNYIVDVVSIRVYIFSNWGLLGSIVGRTLWMLKRTRKAFFFWKQWGWQKGHDEC